MILDVPSILAFFLAAVGCALGAAVAVAGLRRGRAGAEDRGHLLLLGIAVLAGVRAVAWPLHYFVFEGYVDEMAPLGVMCAFGVTRAEPELVLALQVSTPVVLWAAGLWLLAAWIDRRAPDAPLLPARAVAAVPLGLLALADGGVEITYLLRDKLGRTVTCCSQLQSAAPIAEFGAGALDVSPMAAAAGSPWSYAAAHAVVIALAAWFSRAGVRRGAAGWPAVLAMALLGVAHAWIAHAAWSTWLAPRVLGLPYHRCVYELLTDTVALGPAAMLTVAGDAGLLWPPLLQAVRGRAPDVIGHAQRRTYALCAVALATSLLVVAIHAV